MFLLPIPLWICIHEQLYTYPRVFDCPLTPPLFMTNSPRSTCLKGSRGWVSWHASGCDMAPYPCQFAVWTRVRVLSFNVPTMQSPFSSWPLPNLQSSLTPVFIGSRKLHWPLQSSFLVHCLDQCWWPWILLWEQLPGLLTILQCLSICSWVPHPPQLLLEWQEHSPVLGNFIEAGAELSARNTFEYFSLLKKEPWTITMEGLIVQAPSARNLTRCRQGPPVQNLK